MSRFKVLSATTGSSQSSLISQSRAGPIASVCSFTARRERAVEPVKDDVVVGWLTYPFRRSGHHLAVPLPSRH